MRRGVTFRGPFTLFRFFKQIVFCCDGRGKVKRYRPPPRVYGLGLREGVNLPASIQKTTEKMQSSNFGKKTYLTRDRKRKGK